MERGKIVELDKKHIWHPYTRMDDYMANGDPVVAVKAQGVYLFDADGKSYIDGNGSWWTNIVGHNHPRLMEAIVECTRSMVHCSFAGTTHEGAVRLAQRLLPLCGRSFERLFFSDDGSTAVEVAIRMAHQYFKNLGRPEKRRLVTLSGAFHGETVGAASVSGVEVFHAAMSDLLFDRVVIPSPAKGAVDDQWYMEVFNKAEEIIASRHKELAAVIVEPLVQGAAGMLMYPADYLTRLRTLCDEHDILLICDEVFTGYGRTGTFLAHQQAGVWADIVCLAKGFSGGVLPMAATITTGKVFDAFLGGAEKTLWYGHSFTGNPLGCAVANATLDVFEQEDLVAGVGALGAAMQQGLDRLVSRHRVVTQPRRSGLITAFTLKPTGDDDGEINYLKQAGWRFYEAAKSRGALLRPLGNVVYFALPLTVTVQEIEALFEIVDQSLDALF